MRINLKNHKYIREILNANNWSILPLSIFPTAPGQGAIAIEAKKDNKILKEIIDKTYKNFRHPKIAPLVNVDSNKYILELIYLIIILKMKIYKT